MNDISAISRYLDKVHVDWGETRERFPKNVHPKKHWPIPFFGNPANAIVATIGINPSSEEFLPERQWEFVHEKTDWKKRLRDYFDIPIPPHPWFESRKAELQKNRVSYKLGSATHIDISYRPTIAMIKNGRTDPQEFREMVERDIVWLFRLLPLCPRLCRLITVGPVIRSDRTREKLSEFLRQQAGNHGFVASRDGSLEDERTGKRYIIY